MILVFGASGHIGGALASFATQRQAWMRLATSNPAKVAELAQQFPASEVVHASYLDQDSLRAALAGVESVFVVTPDFIDERRAMGSLIQAIREQGRIRSIVRILGDPPNMTLRRIPQRLRCLDKGTAIQHLTAKQILDDISAVAQLLSEVLQQSVAYEPDPEVWRGLMGPKYEQLFGPGAADYFLDYYRFEQANQHAFRRSDVLGTILGRSARTLREWIEQHAGELLSDAKPQA